MSKLCQNWTGYTVNTPFIILSFTRPTIRACVYFRITQPGNVAMREDFAADFYGLPEYVITHIRTEKLKNGNTRVYHWVERCGTLVPSFMALIATKDLAVMNDKVQEALNETVKDGQLVH